MTGPGEWTAMATATVPAAVVGQPAWAAGGPGPAEQQLRASPVPWTVSRFAGFQGGEQSSAVTRESLIEQGVPVAQANARVVHRHEGEVLMMHFRCWILLFSLAICLATPVMFTLLIWLVVSAWQAQGVDCSMPLGLYVDVVCGIVLYNLTVNRPMPRGSCVERLFCRWSRNPDDPQPMPWRVWLYNTFLTAATFAWHCLGLHWAAVDHRDAAGAAACSQAAPDLARATRIYAAFNLVLTVFMYVNMLGFAQLLRIALHRGFLRTTQAAPGGSLEANTEAVHFGDQALVESPACSICLEEFESEIPIVKTRLCKHVFHRQCLKGWLQVNRTCPLCRQDLGKVASAWG